jgi:hypothetical protein
MTKLKWLAETRWPGVVPALANFKIYQWRQATVNVSPHETGLI